MQTVSVNIQNGFIYKGHTVVTKPSGVCYSALIYKNHKAYVELVSAVYGSPLECDGDAQQSAVSKAMVKIDNLK